MLDHKASPMPCFLQCLAQRGAVTAGFDRAGPDLVLEGRQLTLLRLFDQDIEINRAITQ